MDNPLLQQLRIGKASVGLLGFDVAVNRLIGDPSIKREDAVRLLFDAVAEKNYIPQGKEDLYKDALAMEYDRLKAGQVATTSGLTIRILGPGCVSCNNIQKMVIEIMSEMGVAADIFQIHDLDEIGRHGVLQTPALLINGEIKSAGNIPTRSQIEAWLSDCLDSVL